ncbi:MAG: DEAD/DEAH box helicase [Myxococcales bacterium]|nr:DEAD/DEAH box helicase [Myxococcales bacterium]MCB9531144.1 DEAD/DEAH box helicase [Myxococcales bacterium]
MTRVSLTCLDDDDQGRPLEVLWELELGARVLRQHADGIGAVRGTDDPRLFAAWYYALRWNAVTATDAGLFQAPFRAGIKLLSHQLTPLAKALRLPRANLFIADDVGLGKTIEAGLVLQELTLRQRVDFTLVVCPASVTLQWRDELERRFGQRFEIYTRAFVSERRKERGFAVNPWSTHSRFIVSYPMLRRPEHRDPLLQQLGERRARSLLILDEAHHAAPSTASEYAVDSQLTGVVREVAPKFENRLFLSATPHNGHSNSFSALLEIMDPQRFTRGVPVDDARQLEPVMVRRLKEDLRKLGEEFPQRRIVEHRLRHDPTGWRAATTIDGDSATEVELGGVEGDELTLAALLRTYSQAVEPTSGRARLVFVNLQKRLLSSVEAFARTLAAHARALRRESLEDRPAQSSSGLAQASLDLDLEAYGQSDDALDREEADEAASASMGLDPTTVPAELLKELVAAADRLRSRPDAKLRLLFDWIRRHQCPAVALDAGCGADATWSETRLLVFTEYGDTLRYLRTQLSGAVAHTADADQRIGVFHGGMSDDARDKVQRAFNSAPSESPLRILLCTDAAREGVNLQGACATLFHFDIPWNPARMEQRNGRIDRALQPAAEVFCHYFVYPQRAEDRVLAALVRKVDVIQRELGSLGAVIMDDIAAELADGIRESSIGRLEEIDARARARRGAVSSELETQRAAAALGRDLDLAARTLDRSRRQLGHDAGLFHKVIETGMNVALQRPLGTSPLASLGDGLWQLPQFPNGWQATLDSARPPRGRDEPLWEHRKRAPLPVSFEPAGRLRADVVQLHLAHPLAQRVLSRFLAHGWAGDELHRVAVARVPRLSTPHVLAFGRLSLFGRGSSRLHEELVCVAAPWLESREPPHLEPVSPAHEAELISLFDDAYRDRFDRLVTPASVCARVAAVAGADFATLWPHVRDEAEANARDAVVKLRARGEQEASDLRALLDRQQTRLRGLVAQLTIDFDSVAPEDRIQRRQLELDRDHMEKRSRDIERERSEEPSQLRALYDVQARRLEPIGLLYLWPETRS